MKKIMISLIIALTPMIASAEDIVKNIGVDSISVSYKLSPDQTLGNLWDKLIASENFHILDSAMPMIVKSTKNHNWYTGVGTTVYKYKYLDISFQAIKPLESRSKMLPGVGALFQLGAFLYGNVKPVAKFTDRIRKTSTLIDGANLGVGFTRNFSTGEDMPYVFGGLVARWGGK